MPREDATIFKVLWTIVTFDSIQIPAKDSDGLPMDCITFADNLVNYLNDSGIDSEHRVDGSTIYLTIQ